MATKRKFFYKFTDINGNPPFANDHNFSGMFKYDLPKNGKPGKWMKVEGRLKWCENGFHVCSLEQLLEWRLEGCALWYVEVRGKTLKPRHDKHIFSEMRFIEKIGLMDYNINGMRYGVNHNNPLSRMEVAASIVNATKAASKKKRKG